MHIDNLEALNNIKSTLKIGSVTVDKDKNYCFFVVQYFSDIKDILCPVFVQFPLLTSKNLDFQDFHKAVLIKNKTGRAAHLSDINKNKIILLKNGMNSSPRVRGKGEREIFTNISINSQINVNPDWFIGFLEGEGTFGIKTGSSMYFQVAQKITSVECLNAIKTFLINLNCMKAPYFKNNSNKGVILPINVLSTINTKTNVMSLVVSSVDSLYFFLLPLLDKSKMYTFKEMDFKLWRIALILKIHGYYYLPAFAPACAGAGQGEGKKIALQISSSTNKNRYSTSDNKIKLPNIETIKNLFDQTPPFDVNSELSHLNKVKEFTIAKGGRKGFKVYIYECKNNKNKKILKGSPFSTYGDGHEVLGLRRSSRTIGRYIDTGKKYKDKYLFSSVPLTSNT